jgi:hypothetical protein
MLPPKKKIGEIWHLFYEKKKFLPIKEISVTIWWFFTQERKYS